MFASKIKTEALSIIIKPLQKLKRKSTEIIIILTTKFVNVLVLVMRMAMRNKRKYIRMQSTKSHHSYKTVKNPVNTPDKLKLRKFDPVIRAHVEYKEDKLK